MAAMPSLPSPLKSSVRAAITPQREERRMPALVLYEQVERGQFRPLVLEVGCCDNLSLAVGRLPGDRLPSLVVGHGDFVKESGRLDAVTIWRNRGRP